MLWKWMHVLTFAIFFGGCWSVYDAGKKPYPDLRKSAAGFVMIFLCQGLFEVFHWAALRSPIVFITLPVAAGGLFFLWSSRRKASEISSN
jgi:hypothetical protein